MKRPVLAAAGLLALGYAWARRDSLRPVWDGAVDLLADTLEEIADSAVSRIEKRFPAVTPLIDKLAAIKPVDGAYEAYIAQAKLYADDQREIDWRGTHPDIYDASQPGSGKTSIMHSLMQEWALMHPGDRPLVVLHDEAGAMALQPWEDGLAQETFTEWWTRVSREVAREGRKP